MAVVLSIWDSGGLEDQLNCYSVDPPEPLAALVLAEAELVLLIRR